MSHVVALIVAAGQGRRLGTQGNKCLRALEGQSPLERTLDAFACVKVVTGVVVVTSAADVTRVRLALRDAAIAPHLWAVIAGGDSRGASVRHGLKELKMRTADDSVVLVHDAARCFVSPALINRVAMAAAARPWGVAPAVPIVDTVREVDAKGRVVRCVDRTALRAMQTPQAAPLGVLFAAYHWGHAAQTASDELAALEAIGCPVTLVEGDPANVKLTTPSDWALAEARLRCQETVAGPGSEC